MMNMP